MRAHKEEHAAQRRRDTEAVRQMGEELRRQRADQRASWKAMGRKLGEICAETRAAVKSARERLCDGATSLRHLDASAT